MTENLNLVDLYYSPSAFLALEFEGIKYGVFKVCLIKDSTKVCLLREMQSCQEGSKFILGPFH